MIDIDLTPKHKSIVPGLGVFIAPEGVAQLFQLHDYQKCPDFSKTYRQRRTLYPVLRPNVLNCPRYRHVTTRKEITRANETR